VKSKAFVLLIILMLKQLCGFGAIYISRLAVAPWNRVNRSNRRYKGLGKLLVQYVAWRSWNLGLKGRIILEALPGAEEFYLHLGFREIGVGNENLKFYELPRDKARELLKEFRV
jgi:GNAT superfamily N-acetyltransferase